MNDIAVSLGRDPAEIREKNLIQKGQINFYDQLMETSSLTDCWSECLKQSRYYDVKKELEAFNAGNKWKKRGVAIIPTCFGISFNARFMNQAGRYRFIF